MWGILIGSVGLAVLAFAFGAGEREEPSAPPAPSPDEDDEEDEDRFNDALDADGVSDDEEDDAHVYDTADGEPRYVDTRRAVDSDAERKAKRRARVPNVPKVKP